MTEKVTIDKVPQEIAHYVDQIKIPASNSHKGQNGKLLVIGGSELFHSSIFWAADVASRIVDMVHFASPANENNEIVRKQIKEGFWTGIVVDWLEITSYIEEDDCILIGPGMERSKETAEIANRLLTQFPSKKWVIDGGALQMIHPHLLTESCVITPHQHELAQVFTNYQRAIVIGSDSNSGGTQQSMDQTGALSEDNKQAVLDRLQKQRVTVLLKGEVDQVIGQDQSIEIAGGNAGMTKGGTGDVLAGLVAALYCQHDALTAAVVGSYVNKEAGEALWQTVGPYFNAGDLVEQVPRVLWSLTQ